MEERLDQRFTLAEVLELIAPLADSLDYAHSQGIVHRDMKPANVLLDGEGKPILTDFGLAQVLEESTGLTRTDSIVGTPEYMAPEQVLGGPVDGRADLYSLGVIIYRMLLGDIPFPADTAAATLMAHIHQPVPLPSTLDPDVDPRLEEVLLKVLAKDPNERYETSGRLTEAMRSASAQPEAEAVLESEPASETTIEDTGSLIEEGKEGPHGSEGEVAEGQLLAEPSWLKRHSRMLLAVGGVVIFGAILGGVLAATVFGGGDGGKSPALADTATSGPPPPTTGPTQDSGPTALAGVAPNPALTATPEPAPTPTVGSPTPALKATPEPAPTTAPVASTEGGHILRVALGADPAPSSSFDYYRSPSPHLLSAISPAFNGLVEPSPQDPYLLVSGVAERWGTAVGNRWVFDLRSDVRFHNDRPLTAADVDATFDYILANGSSMVRDDLARMVRASEVVGDHAFSITLNAPSASFFPVLGQGFMNIYPQELLDTTAFQNIGNTIIGTGPFRLEQYEPGSLFKYVKNPDYLIVDRPYLDGLHMLVIPDGTARMAALSTQQIDLSLPGLTPTEAGSQEGAGVAVLRGPILNSQSLDFNTVLTPWDDPAVRLAASLAIDRALLRDRVLGGEGGLGHYMPPSGQWALPTDLRPTLYDPDQAIDLLAAAGLQDGFQTDLTITAGDGRELIAVLLLTMWAQVGIDVEIQIVDEPQADPRRSAGSFQAAIDAFRWSFDDPDLILRHAYASGASRNYARFSNSHFDNLVKEQSQTLDQEGRRAIVHEMQLILHQQVPSVVLYWDVLRQGMQHNVVGYQPPQSIFSRNNFAEVRLER